MTEGMRLSHVAREIPGRAVVRGDGDPVVRGVHHDSRRVEPGDLFVVRKGKTADGASFLAQARERGAVAVLVDDANAEAARATGLPLLVVDDAVTGLAHAAAAVYGHPSFSLDVVGVTGTNGKTTTSHLVQAAVDAASGAPKCGVIGTVGHAFAGKTIDASHTTPEADELARVMADMRARGATHVAMEVSSIALALGRVRAVRFRVAAFTNLTQDHLDFHGTMDAYAAAKLELFTTMGPGSAVVNVASPFGDEIAARVKAPLVKVDPRLGAKRADVAPESVKLDASGLDVVLRTPAGPAHVRSWLFGAHNLENVAVAVGVAYVLDLDLARACEGIGAAPGAPGRLERCDGEGDDVTVLVDYAHTPDALTRVLESVRAASAGARVVCVFGCGGDRDPTKRGPMGAAAAAGADVAVITNDNPRSEDPAAIAKPIEDAVRASGKPYVVELDRARAIREAIVGAKKGDVVVLAGKGHEDSQIIGAEKRHFDDRVEARRALQERRSR